MIEIPNQLSNHRFVVTDQKIPVEKDWQNTNNYKKSDKEFIEKTNKTGTYGVLCGYAGLIVVDVDDKKIEEKLLEIDHFKNTFSVKTAGKGLLHFYFYSDKQENKKFLDKDNNTLADLQGKNKLVIGAGSVLKNGKKYSIENPTTIKEIKYDELIDIMNGVCGVTHKSHSVKSDTKNKKSDDELINQIKEKMPVQNILKKAGISLMKNPTDCPFHDSKGGKCFSFTNTLWHCFHCGESGDVITLYAKIYKCDFITAKEDLAKELGLKTRQDLPTKKKTKEDYLHEYYGIPIKKFVVFKGGDETVYKLVFEDSNLTLSSDGLLNANEFRKKFFNEHHVLLSNISPVDWVEIVNYWMETVGEVIESYEDVSTENLVADTIFNELNNFLLVDNPLDATSYGRALFLSEQPDSVYVCNKVLEVILKKNQFKVTMARLRSLLDDYIMGKSRVIRTGNNVSRFFRFRKAIFDGLDDRLIKETKHD